MLFKKKILKQVQDDRLKNWTSGVARMEINCTVHAAKIMSSRTTIPSERGIGRHKPIAREHIRYCSEIPQIKTVRDLSFKSVIPAQAGIHSVNFSLFPPLKKAWGGEGPRRSRVGNPHPQAIRQELFSHCEGCETPAAISSCHPERGVNLQLRYIHRSRASDKIINPATPIVGGHRPPTHP